MKNKDNISKSKSQIKQNEAYEKIRLRESIDNKANGYYERQIACFLGSLRIYVPRDRKRRVSFLHTP